LINIHEVGKSKLAALYEKHRDKVNDTMKALAQLAEEAGVEGAQGAAEALELRDLIFTEKQASKFSPYAMVEGFRLASDAKQSKLYRMVLVFAKNEAAMQLGAATRIKGIRLPGKGVVFSVEGKEYTRHKNFKDRVKRKDKTKYFRTPIEANLVQKEEEADGGVVKEGEGEGTPEGFLSEEIILELELPANLKKTCARTVLKLQLVLGLEGPKAIQGGSAGAETILDVEVPLYLHIHRDSRAYQAKDALLSLKARYEAPAPLAQFLIKFGATLFVRLI